MWGKDKTGNSLSGRGDMEHPEAKIHAMPESRWTEHGAEDDRRNRAHPAGRDKAWTYSRAPRGRREPIDAAAALK